MSMRSVSVLMAAITLAFSYQTVSFADDNSELQGLKSRVEKLEKRVEAQEVVDELGHKFHPIHSLYGIKISGGLTLSAHGVSNIKNADNRGAAAVSADFVIESPVGENGTVALVLDFERGGGIANLPAFFTAPNGNPTGYNADIESFDDDGVHVTQVYYEHNTGDRLFVTVGQLDPTGYFDANDFANDERGQFMANVFVNNPTVEWGGTDNFYAPGVRATYFPTGNFDVSVGVFEGNGDYTDTFDNPFVMVEANLRTDVLGGGNYRLYYWNRQGRDDVLSTATPTNAALARVRNQGVGVSIDQTVAQDIGVWFRAGMQRETVAQFDRFVGAGLRVGGAAFGRAHDSVGFGYAATFISSDYESYRKGVNPAFDPAAEHYMELYYDYAFGGATELAGFHITPDLQYVVNPGGDSDASNVLLYGARVQVYF
ncbi:MAG: carbohydrate porin [Thermodesulfobacteriota bacterium]